MLWFTVWTVLVVGALVGAFFLLRHLYRQGRALAVEAGRSADVLAAAAERATQLAAAAQQEWAPQPVVLDDPGPARTRRAALHEVRLRRRAERRARHEATYRRWQALSR